MEPDDLNASSPADAALATWLRTNAALPPLADDGFSRRVLASLPPVRRRAASRLWFAVAGVAAGLLALLVGAMLPAPTSSPLLAFNAELVGAVDQLLSPAVSGALALTAASLWFAFRDRWRPGWLKRF